MHEKPICVLAGTKRQYQDWIAEHGLTSKTAVYCDTPERLRGMEFSRIEVVGTFYSDCTFASQIYELARTRVR